MKTNKTLFCVGYVSSADEPQISSLSLYGSTSPCGWMGELLQILYEESVSRKCYLLQMRIYCNWNYF